jgi:large conductance mechanosensitive channel
MIKGFKDFIMRGNVIDLAVAVVIGAAFQKLVDTFVSAIITPILNALGGANSKGLGFNLVGGNDKTFIDFSTIINSLVVFLLTALIVYFIFVVPMNKFKELQAKRGEVEVEASAPTAEALLAEIRDELRAGRR